MFNPGTSNNWFLAPNSKRTPAEIGSGILGHSVGADVAVGPVVGYTAPVNSYGPTNFFFEAGGGVLGVNNSHHFTFPLPATLKGWGECK